MTLLEVLLLFYYLLWLVTFFIIMYVSWYDDSFYYHRKRSILLVWTSGSIWPIMWIVAVIIVYKDKIEKLLKPITIRINEKREEREVIKRYERLKRKRREPK